MLVRTHYRHLNSYLAFHYTYLPKVVSYGSKAEKKENKIAGKKKTTDYPTSSS